MVVGIVACNDICLNCFDEDAIYTLLDTLFVLLTYIFKYIQTEMMNTHTYVYSNKQSKLMIGREYGVC